eukprot:6103864-Alexandrium_andersonii.AAC.1
MISADDRPDRPAAQRPNGLVAWQPRGPTDRSTDDGQATRQCAAWQPSGQALARQPNNPTVRWHNRSMAQCSGGPVAQ